MSSSAVALLATACALSTAQPEACKSVSEALRKTSPPPFEYVESFELKVMQAVPPEIRVAIQVIDAYNKQQVYWPIINKEF